MRAWLKRRHDRRWTDAYDRGHEAGYAQALRDMAGLIKWLGED